MTTVEKIHSDFFSAADRLLNEAKAILSKPAPNVAAKAEKCNHLGFTSSKPSVTARDIARKQSAANDLMKSIVYFKENYPLYKFITGKEVDALCKKYNLILGAASKFIGDIPDKNLKEIEAFKLKKEDFTEEVFDWDDTVMNILASSGRGRRNITQISVDRGFGLGSAEFIPEPRYRVEIEVGQFGPHSTKTQATSEKPAFKIVAPEKDFDTRGMTIRDNKLVVDDPIVLQPVKGGYLIVTAWGAEASDELVVNEVNN